MLCFLLVLLTGCSAAFSLRVTDFSVPIANTLGQVCWVRVDPPAGPEVRTASYLGQATYDAGSVPLSERVAVQFFGRSTAPQGACSERREATDVQLSGVFELESETSQLVEVGGAEYGPALADLVNGGAFWLGATAGGNVGVNERLYFTDGRIVVGL